MTRESTGLPDGSSVPVFVDNSGGRRRIWRRLGWALGAAGGGYALVVAMTVAGGNSDAPWGVLIPSDGGKPGAARVVPEPGDETRKFLPEAEAEAEPVEPGPSPSASAPAAARFADKARVPRISPETEPGARASAGADTKKAPVRGGEGGTTTGGTGGTRPKPGNPSAEPTDGQATGSTGAPTEPGTEPTAEPTASSGPTPQGGLLDQIIDRFDGGGAATAGGE
jgi:hypothetical protein